MATDEVGTYRAPIEVQLAVFADEHRAMLRDSLTGLTEAEVREILANAVKPEARVRLGDALAALGRKLGLENEDFEVFNAVQDKTPAEPLGFE